MAYGALPIASAEIINLPQLDVEEIEKDDGVIYRIKAKQSMSLNTLSSDEIDIIYAVAKKFNDMKTKDIVEYMHKEEAYKETEMNHFIPFSLCKNLNKF